MAYVTRKKKFTVIVDPADDTRRTVRIEYLLSNGVTERKDWTQIQHWLPAATPDDSALEDDETAVLTAANT